MRLLFLTDNYLPHLGGSRVYYHNLFSHLRDVDICVLTRRQEGDLAFDRKQSYHILRCPLEESPRLERLHLQALPLYKNLLRYALKVARRFHPDVIAAGELVPTGPVAATLAKLSRRPFLVFTHAEGPATIGRTRWQSKLASWVCGQARRVIAASGNARDGLLQYQRVPWGKIEVMLPGVGEEHFDEQYAATPCAAERRQLLSVGRLVPRKGHLVLLQALPEIVSQVPNLCLTIVGTGPLEGELRDTCRRLGLGERVRFAGRLEEKDLLRAYSQSDCFALPNSDDPETGDTEGFGIVFGEAAAHGLPAIGGVAGGTEHSIRDGVTGLRVDGRAPQAVAGAVRDVLTDPARAQAYGKAGRAMALAEFRWPSRASRFCEILASISEAKQSGAER